MPLVGLSQFTSLFEIGFALHFAVAFLERIYARELPIRIEKIIAIAKSMELFKQEVIEGQRKHEETGESIQLQFAFRTFENPVWVKHNDHVLDRLYALRQDSNGQVRVLKRILSVITFLSIMVALYSVTIHFMIGLDFEMVMGLTPITASTIVLLQLLPLPVTAAIFFFVGRRMSSEVDRKIRGVGELQLILNNAYSSSVTDYAPVTDHASVQQIYHRNLGRSGLIEGYR
jgi:hypothetical protein